MHSTLSKLLKVVFLFFSLNACSPEEVPIVETTELILDQGKFNYTVRGDLSSNQDGDCFFYRAGTHVVVMLGSSSDSIRLEIAYEETKENDTGVFPVKQIRPDGGGFMMMFKDFSENYWQRKGTIEITYSSVDTIIGRIDDVVLEYPEADSSKQISILGHFNAY